MVILRAILLLLLLLLLLYSYYNFVTCEEDIRSTNLTSLTSEWEIIGSLTV